MSVANSPTTFRLNGWLEIINAAEPSISQYSEAEKLTGVLRSVKVKILES
jgi:hypothetical protein